MIKYLPYKNVGATTVGSFAVFIWGFWPLLAVGCRNIPPLEVLSVAFSASVIMSIVYRLLMSYKIFGMFSGSFGLQSVTLLGLLGTNIFFLIAVKTVPPANANVVNHTWPLVLMLSAASLGLLRPTIIQWIGLIIGFLGAVVVIGPASFGDLANFGYIFAFAGGLAWAGYCLARMRFSGGPVDGFAAASAISVPLCLALHFSIEQNVIPNKIEILSMIAIGVGPAGGANILWDYGFSRGDSRFLTSFSYLTPVFSIIFLWVFGYQSPSIATVLGTALVVVGVAFSRDPSNKAL